MRHRTKSELFKFRLTAAEKKKKLQALAARSGLCSDSEYLRSLIRDAWRADRAMRRDRGDDIPL